MNSKNFNIEVKKLDYLYQNLPSSIVAVLMLSIITTFGFYNIVDTQNLIIWFVLNLFLLILRTYSFISYKKNTITLKNFSSYYVIFFIFSSFSGLLWGSIAIYLMPTEIEYKTIIVIFISGLVSSTAISLASKIEMFYMYLFLALSPFIYTLALSNEHSYHLLAVTLFLYMFIVSSLAKKISTTINENIEIAFVNKNLVTELKEKVEEANIANEAKSKFLSVMSHEIRTPLNAIMGFVQVLKKGEKDTKKSKYLDTIDKSSKVLTNVINDILDLSKIESGKFILETTTFQPKDEFESLYLLYTHNAQEKNITMKNSISSDLPTTLNCDVLRIKQILSNLLSNAVKFTPEGKSVELIIDYNETNSSLFFEVKDEGIGIAKENIENITQAFVQADSSTTRHYGGTGLGLSIVTTLLKLFNSKLEIRSEPDKGSSFSFKIDVTQPAQINAQIEELAEANFNNKKILIAEDNKTNQMLIKILLEDLGMNIKIANNGLEAQEMFEKETFDMVLMDINMPVKNGTEAMIHINKYQDERETITPIIALTANAVSGDREKYIEEGFDEYLAKPIDNNEMKRIFSMFLN